jgi:hypothetical protein
MIVPPASGPSPVAVEAPYLIADDAPPWGLRPVELVPHRYKAGAIPRHAHCPVFGPNRTLPDGANRQLASNRHDGLRWRDLIRPL